MSISFTKLQILLTFFCQILLTLFTNFTQLFFNQITHFYHFLLAFSKQILPLFLPNSTNKNELPFFTKKQKLFTSFYQKNQIYRVLQFFSPNCQFYLPFFKANCKFYLPFLTSLFTKFYKKNYLPFFDQITSSFKLLTRC